MNQLVEYSLRLLTLQTKSKAVNPPAMSIKLSKIDAVREGTKLW
jgi:hypothetical protein